jgi:hypothetical protein
MDDTDDLSGIDSTSTAKDLFKCFNAMEEGGAMKSWQVPTKVQCPQYFKKIKNILDFQRCGVRCVSPWTEAFVPHSDPTSFIFHIATPYYMHAPIGSRRNSSRRSMLMHPLYLMISI